MTALQARTERALGPYAGPEVVLDYGPMIERSRRRLIAAGFLVIALGFGGLGTWASLAPLKNAALAPGIIKVASERKTIQHLEGGIIAEILVEEDDEVEAGQVLLRLDDTVPAARVALMRGQYDALTSTMARLEAEREKRESIEWPQALLERQDDPRVSRLIAGEEQVFEARRQALTSQLRVLAQRVEQFAEQIVGLEAQIVSTKTQLELIEEERTAAEVLFKKGIYAKPKYLALKRTAARLAGEIGVHQATIAQVKQRTTETKLRAISLRRESMKEVNDNLQRTQTRIFDVAERVRAAQDTLDRIEIVAPQTGTIVGLYFHTTGDAIRAGEPILDLVPKNDNLVVSARIRPVDIDVVHEGSPAEVRLTAFNMRTTAPLSGTVTKVSADRLTDQSNGLAFYQIEVAVQREDLSDVELYPGMAAEVYIVTGERTALEYLLKPVQDSFRRGMLEE